MKPSIITKQLHENLSKRNILSPKKSLFPESSLQERKQKIWLRNCEE